MKRKDVVLEPRFTGLEALLFLFELFYLFCFALEIPDERGHQLIRVFWYAPRGRVAAQTCYFSAKRFDAFLHGFNRGIEPSVGGVCLAFCVAFFGICGWRFIFLTIAAAPRIASLIWLCLIGL